LCATELSVSTGIKSEISATPWSERNRVSRTLESGRYSWRWSAWSSTGAMRKRPPRSASSRAAKIVGESKRGKHMKSIDPSTLTSATVLRSPITPCAAIGG
jgi:hypothetical protein